MKKFNLNLSNITDKDHVQDWVLLFKVAHREVIMLRFQITLNLVTQTLS